MVITLMSAKMATLDFLKIKVFWINGYVIIFVYDVTQKIILWLELYCRCGLVTKVW